MMKIEFVKLEVKKWGEDFWKRMVDDEWLSKEGKLEVVNRYGGVVEEISKEEFFGDLEKVNSFGELESWFWSIMGEDGDGGFGMWLDEVMKEKGLRVGKLNLLS